MVLSLRKLECAFNKTISEDSPKFPDDLVDEDMNIFARLLSCTSVTEVADITNEQICALFDKLPSFVGVMNTENIFLDGKVERELRGIRTGNTIRRIL